MGVICYDDRIINENYLVDHPKPLSLEDVNKITEQMKKSVCKIQCNKACGTGFFCIIKFNEQKIMKALFTCHHNLAIEKESEPIEKIFYFSLGQSEFYKKITIEDSRLVYISLKYDIVIMEILKDDDIPKDTLFLEIDDKIYYYDQTVFNKNENNSIYILHYPETKKINHSTGVIKNISINNCTMQNTCSTEHGSSGGPLLNLATYKVLGIHKGYQKNQKFNLGTFLKAPFDEFINLHKDNKFINTMTMEEYLKSKYEINNNNNINNNIYSDIITIKYLINREEKTLNLFGKSFVEANKMNCQMIINGIALDICENIEIKKYSKNLKVLQIYLKGIHYITSMNSMFLGCKYLLSLPDIDRWDTSNIVDMGFLFMGCISLNNIADISIWNTEKVVNMAGMFESCISLNSLPDISKWNTSNVRNFMEMFRICLGLRSLPDISKWNINNAININGMFAECKNLIFLPDISKWNTSNVKEMHTLFFRCENLTYLPNISNWNIENTIKVNDMFGGLFKITYLPDISKWNTSKVIDIHNLFINCLTLTSIPDISNWNISKVVDISNIFCGCKLLSNIPDISKWDTSNVTDMSGIFFNCWEILTIPDISKWNTSNVINMEKMFENCLSLSILPNISNWNTKHVSNMNFMFCKSQYLTFLPDISRWDTSNVTQMVGMFCGCISLTQLPDLNQWNTQRLRDFKGMFKGCKIELNIPYQFRNDYDNFDYNFYNNNFGNQDFLSLFLRGNNINNINYDQIFSPY